MILLMRGPIASFALTIHLCHCLVIIYRSTDDTSQFHFSNGATLHFYFDGTTHKDIANALQAHGTTFADYDMLFANRANAPVLNSKSLLSSARYLKEVGVPFFWMKTYEGHGLPDTYCKEKGDSKEFKHLGVKVIPVHQIMKDVKNFTKGQVEGVVDNHFCMPGPSNEVSLFLMQIIWSAWLELPEKENK